MGRRPTRSQSGVPPMIMPTANSQFLRDRQTYDSAAQATDVSSSRSICGCHQPFNRYCNGNIHSPTFALDLTKTIPEATSWMGDPKANSSESIMDVLPLDVVKWILARYFGNWGYLACGQWAILALVCKDWKRIVYEFPMPLNEQEIQQFSDENPFFYVHRRLFDAFYTAETNSFSMSTLTMTYALKIGDFYFVEKLWNFPNPWFRFVTFEVTEELTQQDPDQVKQTISKWLSDQVGITDPKRISDLAEECSNSLRYHKIPTQQRYGAQPQIQEQRYGAQPEIQEVDKAGRFWALAGMHSAENFQTNLVDLEEWRTSVKVFYPVVYQCLPPVKTITKMLAYDDWINDNSFLKQILTLGAQNYTVQLSHGFLLFAQDDRFDIDEHSPLFGCSLREHIIRHPESNINVIRTLLPDPVPKKMLHEALTNWGSAKSMNAVLESCKKTHIDDFFFYALHHYKPKPSVLNSIFDKISEEDFQRLGIQKADILSDKMIVHPDSDQEEEEEKSKKKPKKKSTRKKTPSPPPPSPKKKTAKSSPESKKKRKVEPDPDTASSEEEEAPKKKKSPRGRKKKY